MVTWPPFLASKALVDRAILNKMSHVIAVKTKWIDRVSGRSCEMDRDIIDLFQKFQAADLEDASKGISFELTSNLLVRAGLLET